VRKKIKLPLFLIVAYLAISCIFNYLIFPEPLADPSDLPRSGAVLVNEGIRSKFVYRRTSIETAGQLFEWDNFVDPGGGPGEIPHVHPHMREVFQVVDGELQFVIDGRERIAKAGETVVAEPGTVHAFRNVSGRPAHMISQFEPAEDGPWERLAEEGLLPDSTFVQIDRAGGLGPSRCSSSGLATSRATRRACQRGGGTRSSSSLHPPLESSESTSITPLTVLRGNGLWLPNTPLHLTAAGVSQVGSLLSLRFVVACSRGRS